MSIRVYPKERYGALDSTITSSLFNWLESVKDISSNEPISPTEGDRYIVNLGATNNWTGYDKYIAEYTSGEWKYIMPFSGAALYVENLDDYYVYNGTAWVTIDSIIEHNQLANIQGGGVSDRYHMSADEYAKHTTGVDASQYHHHDGRYSLLNHNHDDSYYTKNQTDILLDNKQDKNLDTSNFDNILSASEATVQKAFDKIDDEHYGTYDNELEALRVNRSNEDKIM